MRNAHLAVVAGAVVLTAGVTAAIDRHVSKTEPVATPSPTATVSPSPSATPEAVTATVTKVTNDAVGRTNVITGTVTNAGTAVQSALVTVTFKKAGAPVYAASTLVTGILPGSTKAYSFQTSDLYTDYDSTSVSATVQ